MQLQLRELKDDKDKEQSFSPLPPFVVVDKVDNCFTPPPFPPMLPFVATREGAQLVGT